MARPLPFRVHHDGVAPLSLLAPVSVVLVDASVLSRRTLADWLGKQIGITVLAQATDVHEAIMLTQETVPDILILDGDLPGTRVLDDLGTLQRSLPSARVLVLASAVDDPVLSAALRMGAEGFLLKDLETDELADRLRMMASGQIPIAPSLVTRLVRSMRRPAAIAVDVGRQEDAHRRVGALSTREREVMHLVASGMTNRQIGRALSITEGTVKNHVHNALQKLGLDDRMQAASVVANSG